MGKGGEIDLHREDRITHHRNRSASGRVVIPERLGWWKQIQRERMCKRMHGHCYHSHLMTYWNCCMCGGTAEGLPVFRCNYCVKES